MSEKTENMKKIEDVLRTLLSAPPPSETSTLYEEDEIRLEDKNEEGQVMMAKMTQEGASKRIVQGIVQQARQGRTSFIWHDSIDGAEDIIKYVFAHTDVPIAWVVSNRKSEAILFSWNQKAYTSIQSTASCTAQERLGLVCPGHEQTGYKVDFEMINMPKKHEEREKEEEEVLGEEKK